MRRMSPVRKQVGETSDIRSRKNQGFLWVISIVEPSRFPRRRIAPRESATPTRMNDRCKNGRFSLEFLGFSKFESVSRRNCEFLSVFELYFKIS